MQHKKLTKEEELKLRESIRKELENIEGKRSGEIEHTVDDNFNMELEKRRIRNEEIENYYVSKGYKKYINHHGGIEWLSQEEYNKRLERKSKSKNRRDRSRKSKYLTTTLFILIIMILTMIIAYLFVKYTF